MADPRPLAFYVYGTPGPQGSKKAVGTRNGRPILVESSTKVAPWRDAVAAASLPVRPTRPLDGPLRVSVAFTLTKPQRPSKGRTHPTTYPDLDKLIRSTFDALSAAQVWADDARVVAVSAAKVWPGDDLALPTSGAVIAVGALGDEPAIGQAFHRALNRARAERAA